MTVVRLQHASVPRPPGQQSATRAVEFYAGVLGMEHIPKPETFGAIDVLWFRCGDDEVHVYAAEPGVPRPDSGAHFCLVVDDLGGARSRIQDAGCRYEEAVPVPNRPRFYTWDPFGNQIEITTIAGDYR
jgi:catechol 2,3-dioxygenase-like lactoylglutathione lyase family enzyme